MHESVSIDISEDYLKPFSVNVPEIQTAPKTHVLSKAGDEQHFIYLIKRDIIHYAVADKKKLYISIFQLILSIINLYPKHISNCVVYIITFAIIFKKYTIFTFF